MSYHKVTINLLSDDMVVGDTDPSRLIWDISTQYTKNCAFYSGEAYTAKADDYKILRWTSNDAVIPNDIMDGITWPHKAVMDKARGEQTRTTLASYFEAQANRTPEQIAEENFEMRAAFGDNVEVVNVLTGKRTQL